MRLAPELAIYEIRSLRRLMAVMKAHRRRSLRVRVVLQFGRRLRPKSEPLTDEFITHGWATNILNSKRSG